MAREEIEKLEAIVGQGRDDVIEVWPENWPALAYLTMEGNWRVVPKMRGLYWQGIEFTALPVVLEVMQVPRDEWAATLAAIRGMEAAAREVLNDSGGEQ